MLKNDIVLSLENSIVFLTEPPDKGLVNKIIPLT